MAFTLRGEGTETLELDIYDVIGESFFSEGVTAQDVRRRLKQSQDAKTIRVRINSVGGDIVDGLAIHNLLAEHAARVEVDVDGLAASMASVIAMAGDEIRMFPASFMMVHNPWGFAIGEADDMRAHADLLDKMGDTLIGIYAKRTGNESDAVRQMMADETWMTGPEAVAAGFADKINEKPKKQSKAALHAFAMARASGFSRLPEEIASATKSEPQPQQTAQLRNGPEPTQRVANQTPPAPPAEHEPALVGTGEQAPNEQEKVIMKDVLKTLALSDDADEAAVIAAIKKLQASAHAGAEIEKIVGYTGGEAIGAVRALKEIKSQHEDLRGQVAQLQAAGARREFEAARDEGLKDRKLTPAQAKFYSDQFEAALADGGDAAAIVAQLKGWLQVTPKNRVVGPALHPAGESEGAAQYNGKKYEEMAPAERARLKKESPELHDTLRADAVAREAL